MIELAKKAAIEAGKRLLKLRGKTLKTRKKAKRGNFATEADDSAEKIIFDVLKSEFPDFNYLSEESGRENKGSEYTWVIDPLDGTTPFVSGLDFFGVSIGLLKSYKPYLGVINLPVRKELYWAVEGAGAYLNGEETSVSKEKKIEDSLMGFDLAHQGQRREELENIVANFADEVRYPVTLGATVAGLSLTAQGIYEGYIHSAYPWDFAAGTVIIKEAGGKVTDFKGEEIDWKKDWVDVLATNGNIHDDLLSLIK